MENNVCYQKLSRLRFRKDLKVLKVRKTGQKKRKTKSTFLFHINGSCVLNRSD